MKKKKRYKYGGNSTIHRTGWVDVETNEAGEVVGVWFRCHMLRFKQSKVEGTRSDEMKESYSKEKIPVLISMEFEER